MKKLLLAVAFSLFGLLSATEVKASHIMGGELTYHWISGNNYELKLTLYRDCYGIPAPTVADVNIYSSCGANMTVTLFPVSSTNITPACDTTMTCINANLPGVEKYVYTGLVTLPGTCSDYTFYWTSCCRNAAITNLANASGFGATFYATMDNSVTPFNNSPVFANDPVIYLFAGQSYHINNGMYDADGDSLVISMVNPLGDNIGLGGPLNALPIAYNAPFTYTNPVSSLTPLTIDATTGEILITPLNVEVDVWAYIVDEYRNGVKIGSITRDVQLIILPGTDQLPELSGLNNYSVYTANVCAGDSLSFDLYTSDADTADSTSIAWHFFGQPNYTLNVNAGQHESATFTWATDSAMVSPNPYLLYVSVKDNACPFYGFQTYVYKIYVNQCITNDVWPGDANSDLSCDMYDILPIGLAYGATGPVRAGASLTWVAQPATAWANAIASGVNFKHADCDGNGVVDSTDLFAITLNFGSAHSKNGAFTDPYVNGLADLSVAYSASVVAPGTPVTATINLGSASIPMTDIYGITYTLNYDQNMFQQGSVNFNTNNSFVGNASNSVKLIQGVPDYGNLKVGMVRIDHNNAQGSGEIAQLNFIANPFIQGDVTFNMSFNSVKIITNTGSTIPVNVVNQNEITISQLLSVNEIGKDISSFTIRPNQVTDVMVIDYTLAHSSAVSIEVFDIIGNKTKTVTLHNQTSGTHAYTMNAADFAKGTYLVRMVSDNGVATQRMVKL